MGSAEEGAVEVSLAVCVAHLEAEAEFKHRTRHPRVSRSELMFELAFERR